MSKGSIHLAWLICAVPGALLAQERPPDHGIFVEPVVGSNALTLGWTGTEPYLPATDFGPSLRVGALLPSFAADGRLSFFNSGNPFSRNGTTGIALGGELSPYLWTLGSARFYGLGGLNFGALFVDSASGSSSYSEVLPNAGLTLGVGLHYFLTPQFAIGAEGGARTQVILGNPTSTEISTGFYIALTGTLLPQAPAFQTQEKPPVAAAPAPPAQPPGPDPSDVDRPPVVYGHSEARCAAYVTDGWFEPTQGVWQDDLTFDDKPTKQLTRAPGDGVAYRAELNMVKGKDTLLFGVHHYRKSGEVVTVDSRDFIVLRGVTNCTIPTPVKFKFSLHEVGSRRTLYTSPVLAQLPLDGAPSTYKPWEVRLSVRDGLPPDSPFRIESDLPYQLIAELVRDNDAPTGLEMTVDGQTESAMGPKVHFVPLFLTPQKDGDEEALVRAATTLAEDTAKYTPDLFPLPPSGLPTFVKVVRNLTELDIPSKWFEARRIDATVAALNDSLASSTFLDGAGRIVAVMSRDDFKSIFGDGAVGMTVDSSVTVHPKAPNPQHYKSSVTLSWKVMLVPSSETWDTVAHELVHTLPEGWAEDEMLKECNRAYHNENVPIAHGERIDDGGVPGTRVRMAGMIPLMGPWEPVSAMWITQCTYWHLVKELAGSAPPDPPVLLVRALLFKDGQKVQGQLRPLYTLMGHSDLRPGKGSWAIVLRDAQGKELGRYPMTPRWNDIETRAPRHLISMVFRVPELPNVAQVELVGPGGVLDRKRLSAQAPSIQIQEPADSAQLTPVNGKVHIAWSATGGAPLLYSVLYSSDGGANYLDQAFEQKQTSFDLRINPAGKNHRVKIIATDGTRSSEAVVRFTLKTP